MKIANIRAGFATNSSSSHSIVMIPAGQRVSTDEYNRFNYGWEQFTLADPDSKSAYFVTQLMQGMRNSNLSDAEAVFAINNLLGTGYTDTDFGDNHGVDHQSVWYGLAKLMQDHPAMVQDMYRFIQRDDVLILGGNDNSEGQTPPDNSFQDTRTDFFQTGNTDLRVRSDRGWWITYNPLTGMKMRLNFDNTAADYVKSSMPELVDLKVTDQCLFGCKFCYMSSTKEGKHADLASVKKILDALADMGVFEVAIGGGEPTHNPDLPEILTYAHQLGITPNFTTFGVDWLRNQQLVDTVKHTVGAVGVSVHKASDLKKVKRIVETLHNGNKWSDRYVNVTAQHVVGTVDLADTADLLEQTWQQGVNLLLLGYKNVGFGTRMTPHDLEGLDTLLKLRQTSRPHWGTSFSMLGVDTAFVQNFGALLEEMEINRTLLTSEEGAFSMYVDAVTLTQGPSSYMPEKMIPLDVSKAKDSILEAYAKW